MKLTISEKSSIVKEKFRNIFNPERKYCMSKSEPLSDDNYLFVPLNEEECTPPPTVSYFGWHKCSSSHTNYSTFKRCYTLHIILRGKGYYSHGDVKHELKENDFFLIAPAETVSYYPDAKDPWEYIWFGFTGEEAGGFLDELNLSESPVGALKNTKKIQTLFERLKDEKQRMALNSFGYYAIFMGIFAELLDQRIFPVHHSARDSNATLQQALNYISEHYSEDISIAELSSFLYVNRTTLFKAFKKAFNLSPQQYIIEYRLRIAQQHICETKLPLTTIAEKCGFPCYSHFSRIFASKFGCSPSKMRKSTNFGGVPSIPLPGNTESPR